MDEYVKTLEKRITELEDIISRSVAPSTYGVLKYLVEEKRIHIKNRMSQTNMMSFDTFIWEACVIHFNPGRQFGKSSSFLKLSKEYDNCFFIRRYKDNTNGGLQYDEFKNKYSHGMKNIKTDLVIFDDMGEKPEMIKNSLEIFRFILDRNNIPPFIIS